MLMKNSFRKRFWNLLALSSFVVITTGFVLGQSTINQSSTTDGQVMLLALEQTTPVPASSVPNAGTFWSAQHAPGTAEAWPPFPDNMWNLSVWPLGGGQYLLDDRNVNYDSLAAIAAAAQPTTTTASMSMTTMNLASIYAYSNPVYITNTTANFAGDGSVTVNFNVAGGTNFVPYDIEMSTNLASRNWIWQGIAYTSNNYTLYGQPADLAFYRLAKPTKTMIVPWGNDTYGQCDLWSGITNAVQVTGGIQFSLALLSDGKVTGWGYNGATPSELVPSNLTNVMMIASGWQHNVALLANGTVTAWGDDFWGETNVPAGLTNVIAVSAQGLHSLALKKDGTVVAWGYDSSGETNVPVGLSNVTAIAAGGEHSLAVSNGFVVAWGNNEYTQCDVPSDLSNVWDVAAGWAHSVALKSDGKVVCWGDNSGGQCQVPAGLSNVVAIAAGGDPETGSGYTLALKKDGNVIAWGNSEVVGVLNGMSNVISLGSGADHALAIRTGPPTPVITLEPTNEYQAEGATATFSARGVGLYGVTYQWQNNGMDISGQTNASLTLTNVQPGMEGPYDVVVTDNGYMGSIVSSNATLTVVTPPIITSQSQPTNIVCIYGNYVGFSVTASAPDQTHGFPLSYQWQLNGTNISGATNNTFNFTADDNSSGTYSVLVSNAAGSTNASWLVNLTNTINVTNDVLLVFNTNSTASTTLKNYYLAHRPMIAGANVLGIGCDTNEITPLTNYISQIESPVFNWLTNNPTKRPQYVVLFFGIPTRLTSYPGNYGSVSYNLHSDFPDWRPYVNYINAGSLADCEAYVNKLEYFGTNYSPGKLIISASAGGYGDTNYFFDDIRNSTYGSGPSFGNDAQNGVLAANPNALITYVVGADDGTLTGHITNAFNVAGYLSWGFHSSLGSYYATNGTLNWTGNSSWYLIETVESFNGQRSGDGGNFTMWFSQNAFGGKNYSNTPIGAVTHVEEPLLQGVENSATYFGLWEDGKNFGICAWSARKTQYFQAVGDPLISK